jgi:hypothetical protein
MLIVSIEQGNADQEKMIREELKSYGLITKDNLELLEETL